MKLLFCSHCHDVFVLLGHEWWVCACGRSGGQYNADSVTATLGGDARVFGIANPFFEPLWPILTPKQRQQLRVAQGYGDQTADCWWGDYPGDQQIFRVEAATGPRLVVAVERQADETNTLRIDDKRPFRWSGAPQAEEPPREIRGLPANASSAVRPRSRRTQRRRIPPGGKGGARGA